MSDLTVPFIGLLFALFVIVPMILRRYTTAGYAGLLRNGRPALGILLQVGNTGTSLEGVSPAVECRDVTLDIEIPGEAPYEMRLTVQFYANLRASVLPGATVELRVDAKNRQRVAIVGPGTGFDSRAFTPAQP